MRLVLFFLLWVSVIIGAILIALTDLEIWHFAFYFLPAVTILCSTAFPTVAILGRDLWSAGYFIFVGMCLWVLLVIISMFLIPIYADRDDPFAYPIIAGLASFLFGLAYHQMFFGKHSLLLGIANFLIGYGVILSALKFDDEVSILLVWQIANGLTVTISLWRYLKTTTTANVS